MIYFKFSEFLFFFSKEQNDLEECLTASRYLVTEKLKVAGDWFKIESLFTFMRRSLNPAHAAVPVMGLPELHMWRLLLQIT